MTDCEINKKIEFIKNSFEKELSLELNFSETMRRMIEITYNNINNKKEIIDGQQRLTSTWQK
jgi:uncharacterized protein with ParB-like and HNH nuclease domain